jgi:hypothetical protein
VAVRWDLMAVARERRNRHSPGPTLSTEDVIYPDHVKHSNCRSSAMGTPVRPIVAPTLNSHSGWQMTPISFILEAGTRG